jgi:ubiquinone/menaquinone biosynthesis C-methylase UbiE
MPSPTTDRNISLGGSSPNQKQNIRDRFSERAQAERYRNRFKKGRRQATHRREVAALENALSQVGSVETILDVACGAGRFASTLAAHCRKIFQTDYSIHMLDINREDFPFDADRSGYFQADASAIPLTDKSVDLVFCHRFLNHVPDEAIRGKIMKEFARISRQYVVVSCLGPVRIIRTVRYLFNHLIGKKSLDGYISDNDLIKNAADAGLELVNRTPIRAFGMSAFFLTFRKK